MDPLELDRVSREYNIPLTALKQLAADPGNKGKTPEDLAKGVKMAQILGKQIGTTGKIDTEAAARDYQQQQQVTVTGKRPPIPTTVAPWAGSAQERAAGDEGNPTASSLSQFDPAQRLAAEQEFERRWKEGQTARDLQNIITSFGGNIDRAREYQKGQYEKLYDQTIGRQKRLEETARGGIDAVNVESDRLRAEGQFQGTQRQKQLELEQLGFTVDQQRRLNQENSIETLSLKAMLPQLLAQPGINPEIARQLREIASRPGVTAAQLAPLVGQLSPQALDQWVKATQGQKTQAETGLVGQETRKVRAEADIASVLAEAVKSGKINLTEALRYATLSAGGVTIPPNPTDVALAGEEAKAIGGASERAKVYDTQLAPTMTRIRQVMAKTDPGKLTGAIAKWMPGNDKQELVNLLNAANNTYGAVLPPGVSEAQAAAIRQGGFTGALVESMTGPQIEAMLKDIETKARLDRSSGVDASKRPPEVRPGTVPLNKPMASSVPPAGLPAKNDKGWVLMEDAKGNKAYVGPNGEIEEVK